jgi:hypothetical protein
MNRFRVREEVPYIEGTESLPVVSALQRVMKCWVIAYQGRAEGLR